MNFSVEERDQGSWLLISKTLFTSSKLRLGNDDADRPRFIDISYPQHTSGCTSMAGTTYHDESTERDTSPLPGQVQKRGESDVATVGKEQIFIGSREGNT